MSDEERGRWGAKTEHCGLGICYPVSAVELVGVGPAPGETCGDIYHQIEVNWKNCCDFILPLAAHPDNPTEISSNNSVVMCVFGGGSPLTWTAGGGLYFHGPYGNHVTTVETGNSAPNPTCVRVYSLKDFCEDSKVQVADECTGVSMNLHKPDAIPLELCDDAHRNIVMAPDSYYNFESNIHGGVPPYTGWASSGLEHIGGGVFKAPSDFCGTATVTVMDSCMASSDCTVRSTEGWWEAIYSFNPCSAPNGLMVYVSGDSNICIGGGYKAEVNIYYGDGATDCIRTGPCPGRNVITTADAAWYASNCSGISGLCGREMTVVGECCRSDVTGSYDCSTPVVWSYSFISKYIQPLWKWVC